MHRTRTTAKVLVGLAVAAVSGCVSVEPRPAAPPPPTTAGISRPAQDVEPHVVQAPAREALEAATRPEPAPPRQDAPERAHGKKHKADRPGRKEPKKNHLPVTLPPVLPKFPAHPPRSRGEVCDLGEKYGGWGHGSDQARICRSTYGGGRG